MDGTPYLHAGLDSHRAFRPNIYQTTSPSRVSSDPTNKDDKSYNKHKAHRHHKHGNHHDRHHRHSSGRRHAKEVVQSAIQLQPPTSFGDLLKQARGSKDTSPSHSCKASVVQANVDGHAESKESDVGITILPRMPIRLEDVELERKRVEARERDLRTALQTLSDQSLKTSRRLDDTYYSILEKVSVLRQTIGSLQELSGLTKDLHQNFESNTKELVDDVKGQFDSFDSFDTQQQQINGLEQRIKAGKDKANTLADRLAKVKERVDTRAQTESEWKMKNTRRLRIFWSISGSIAAVIFALILFHQFRPIHLSEPQTTALDFASRTKIMDAPIPDIAKEAIIGSPLYTTSSNFDRRPTNPARVVDDDGWLRVFDEL